MLLYPTLRLLYPANRLPFAAIVSPAIHPRRAGDRRVAHSMRRLALRPKGSQWSYVLSDTPVVRRPAWELVGVPFTGATKTPAESLERVLKTIGARCAG